MPLDLVQTVAFAGLMLGWPTLAFDTTPQTPPKASLVVPLVGAFGIDFVNGLLITLSIDIGR
jgi:sodium--glutamate symport carrier gltS